MNLLDTILGAGGGSAITQIARQVGIPESVATQAVKAITPALSRGLQRNAAAPGGLESLLGALSSGQHARYVDEPEKLGNSDTIADGNAILGHILGSKDVSRNVAGNASKQTGLDAATLKKMLPMLGAVAMGALAKNTSGGSQLSALGGGGDPLNALTGFLDADKDGPEVDDLLNLAKKFF